MNDEVPGLTRAALHRARISRDARFDGKFFIAVLTTGVYCRPICPSPRSKKSHVRYFATAAAAAAAGYRPCRRCRPEVAPGSPAWLGPPAVVRRALRLIDEGALDDASVDDLALRLGVGSRHLDRLFATHVGVSPIAVAQTRRLHFAKQLLDETDLPITRIAMTAGFGSLRRFNEAFRAAFRSTPRASRRRRQGHNPGGVHEVSLSLSYRPPYDWDSLAEFLRGRAIRGVERIDGNGYARTIRLGAAHARVLVAPVPAEHALRLHVSGAQPKDLFDIATAARRVFDLSADPVPIVEMLSDDPVLAPLVARHPGLRLPGIWGTFECAVRAVLGQRTSIASARILGERLVERAGDRISDAAGELTHLFPSPERLANVDLAGIGLTASKVAALRALARAALDGHLELAALPTDELVRTLGKLPGVSDWATQYVAMHALAEPDAFPGSDRVVRRAMAAARTLAPIALLKRRAEGWRPWRSYATLHLWQAAADR
ncbi:MAG: helix-turn-helix domain-containing protein [Gammaproteobacteria bacterium]|nr:helix-turn-helix domain-containing protein [Gammaproteobacteria bacterium]